MMIILKYTYTPLTSVEVEHLFSLYKLVLSKKRTVWVEKSGAAACSLLVLFSFLMALS